RLCPAPSSKGSKRHPKESGGSGAESAESDETPPEFPRFGRFPRGFRRQPSPTPRTTGVRGQGSERQGPGVRGQGSGKIPELTPDPRPLSPGAERRTPDPRPPAASLPPLHRVETLDVPPTSCSGGDDDDGHRSFPGL